jgi:17beta-estradiol 17-dehydrogenase / very-long-chain 3-oxoacyl-CoA reductase
MINFLLLSFIRLIKHMEYGNLFLKAAGVAALGYCVLQLLRALPLRRKLNLKAKYGKFGRWAVVTGASDGIGRALAVELAVRGFNVVVVARTKSKLDDVVAEIAAANPKVRGEAVVFDFEKGSYDALLGRLAGFDISIVVNNVGMSLESPELFDEYPVEDDERMVVVNCLSQVRISKFAIAAMRRQGGGALVDLSSISAVVEKFPFLSTYAATKAFNRIFSKSIAAEMKQFNIDVLTVTPSGVSTKMTQGVGSRRPRTSFFMVNPCEMARDTLNALGVYSETCGHRNHNIFLFLLSLLPLSLRDFMFFKMLRSMREQSKKKKQEKLATQST